MSDIPSVFGENEVYTDLALEVSRRLHESVEAIYEEFKDRILVREMAYLAVEAASFAAKDVVIGKIVKNYCKKGVSIDDLLAPTSTRCTPEIPAPSEILASLKPLAVPKPWVVPDDRW